MMRAMTSINALREHSRITWIEQEHGWAATPGDIVTVLSNEGFEECKRGDPWTEPIAPRGAGQGPN
jgi:hypothetical protein